MSRKVTDYLAKTLLIALMALSSFLFRNLAVKLFILISILKTTIFVSSIFSELFLDMSSRSVT